MPQDILFDSKLHHLCRLAHGALPYRLGSTDLKELSASVPPTRDHPQVTAEVFTIGSLLSFISEALLVR